MEKPRAHGTDVVSQKKKTTQGQDAFAGSNPHTIPDWYSGYPSVVFLLPSLKGSCVQFQLLGCFVPFYQTQMDRSAASSHDGLEILFLPISPMLPRL
jgi:hypothetical protein